MASKTSLRSEKQRPRSWRSAGPQVCSEARLSGPRAPPSAHIWCFPGGDPAAPGRDCSLAGLCLLKGHWNLSGREGKTAGGMTNGFGFKEVCFLPGAGRSLAGSAAVS